MPVNSIGRLFFYFPMYQATVGIYEAWDEAYEVSYLGDDQDLSMTLVGTSQSLAFLPWAFKFIFSYITDKWNFFGLGWRRPYCAIGLAIAGLCFCSLTLFSPRDYFPLYVFVMMTRNGAVALADGATEGLSVDANVEEISGKLQAWMMVGRMIGMMVGSAAGGPIAAQSYQNCMLFLGFSMIAFIPINFVIKEERQYTKHGQGYTNVGVTTEDLATANAVDAATPKDKGTGADNQGYTAPSSAAAVDASMLQLQDGPAPAKPTASLNTAGSTGETGNGSSVSGGPSSVALEEGGTGSTSGRAPSTEPGNGNGSGTPSGEGGEGFAVPVDSRTEFQVLLGQLKERPIYMFVLYTFITNLGTYIASFPIVMWLVDHKDFSIEEVGWLTVIAACGNMLFSVVFGYAFDRVKNKQIMLYAAAFICGATYFTFLIAEGKPALMLAQGIIAGGTGALYTVQSSTIRLIADERIGASMFGVVIGALNLAAFLGTFMGGPLSDHLSMEHCYIIGGIMGMVGMVCVPWIKISAQYKVPEKLPPGVTDPNAAPAAGIMDSTGGKELPLLVSNATDIENLEVVAVHPTVARFAHAVGLAPAAVQRWVDMPGQAWRSLRSAAGLRDTTVADDVKYEGL